MDGIIWLFLTLITAIAALAMMLEALRRRSSGVKKSGHCPNCETPMSMRRVSRFKSLLFFPSWLCPHCGTRSRSRKGVKEMAA
jgi:transposase-like protein